MNELIINNQSITNEFIKEYEMTKEEIKDIEDGELYKVRFTLNDEGLKQNVMNEFAPNEGDENTTGFIQVDERNAMFIAEVTNEDEGIHQIEMEVGHMLQGGELGSYTIECIKE